MSESERLVVYYAMDLYLIRDDDNALKLINKYVLGLKQDGSKDGEGIKGCLIFEANI
jgi:hypothetical protein